MQTAVDRYKFSYWRTQSELWPSGGTLLFLELKDQIAHCFSPDTFLFGSGTSAIKNNNMFKKCFPCPLEDFRSVPGVVQIQKNMYGIETAGQTSVTYILQGWSMCNGEYVKRAAEMCWVSTCCSK